MSGQDPAERARRGQEARKRVPPEAHAQVGTTDRHGPVGVLTGQLATRVPELVPMRHARMLASPFAFFRGAAAIMAVDLAGTPVSGLDVQLCGDAHLSNFGMFASPERNLVFDVNDFDETCPGPWEWDLKRLVSSLVVAGRGNGLEEEQTHKIVIAAVRRYRDAMADFAAMGNLALWYSQIDGEEVLRLFGDRLNKQTQKRMEKATAKARRRTHLRALDKLTEVVDGRRRIVADPPFVVPISDLAAGMEPEKIERRLQDLLLAYSDSLDPGHRALARSYTLVDVARKVVGVGSVGMRCYIVLMRGRDDADSLLLQVKETAPSVLAPHLGEGAERNEGERVVVGQRIMQASGDVFLGWHRASGLDGTVRDFYVRQLQDWKGSAKVETMTPKTLRLYGALCGWALARAHARSGDRIALAAYLGDDDRLPQSLAEFAHAYADLNEQDYASFSAAVRAGELTASETGLP